VNKFTFENLCVWLTRRGTLPSRSTTHVSSSETVEDELMEYVQAHWKSAAPIVLNVINSWLTNASRFPVLSPLALDFLRAAASVACAERVFSVCRELTSGKLNRTSNNLGRRVFLRGNCSNWLLMTMAVHWLQLTIDINVELKVNNFNYMQLFLSLWGPAIGH